MKFVVVLFILFILYSLGSALYFLLKDQSGRERMVRALTMRIALSITLFLILILGYQFGFITGKL